MGHLAALRPRLRVLVRLLFTPLSQPRDDHPPLVRSDGMADIAQQQRGIIVPVAALGVEDAPAHERDGTLSVARDVRIAGKTITSGQQQHARAMFEHRIEGGTSAGALVQRRSGAGILREVRYDSEAVGVGERAAVTLLRVEAICVGLLSR